MSKKLSHNVKLNFKSIKMKFWFRLFAMFDVLFSSKFELTTYSKDWTESSKTKFDKEEIENAGRSGLL